MDIMDDKDRQVYENKFGASLASQIIDWLAESGDKRPFHRRDIISDFQLLYRNDPRFQSLTYRTLNKAMKTLCDAGVIASVPSKTFGWYRPVDNALDEMHPWDAIGTDVDIWLPLDIMDRVRLFPGSIALFSGMNNAGKSCFSLNIAKENAARGFNVKYFNNEMSSVELRERLEMFGVSRSSWDGVRFYRRYENFQDVVDPNPNTINIVDFLNVHEDFASIGGTLFGIHKQLGESLCIINMQLKNPESKTALGGFRTLEYPRLAVAITYGKAEFVKVKAWRDKNNNPNGAVCEFKLVHGYNLIPKNGVSFKWLSQLNKTKEGTS